MTTPNVFMYWCQHKARCRWCEENILTGTPVVQVYYWNKGDPAKRSFNVKRYYHPQCWIDQGLDHLKMNPYVPYQRKTKSKELARLTARQRELRYKLLRRKASIDQRIRNLSSDYPNRALEEAHLNEQVSRIMVQIVKVGGIPKKWLR